MRPQVLIAAILAAAVALVIFGFGMQIGNQSNYRAGGWGLGMMGGYAMGPGMMGAHGYAMGPWMMAPNAAGIYGYGSSPWTAMPSWNNQVALDLSVDDVSAYFERWLVLQGKPRVKLGTVSENDNDTITVDIVTTDNDGLVQRLVVNRRNGFILPGED